MDVNPRHLLLAALSVIGIATLAYVMFGESPLVPLVPLEEGPRPPVAANDETKHQLFCGLRGLKEAERAAGADITIAKKTTNARRHERNELAVKHREAIVLWRAGGISLREVESIEQELWVAREHIGEITAKQMHAKLAELFGRETKRLAILHENGHAGRDQLERARLYEAREQHLAGLPLNDPKDSTYEQRRREYLVSVKRRHELLIEAGLGPKEYLGNLYADLKREFPPVEESSSRAEDAGDAGHGAPVSADATK